MASTMTAAAGGEGSEMGYRSRPMSIFTTKERPTSTFTDFDDSDWEDEDAGSDGGSVFEEDSPRGSFDTLTTVDETPTPEDSVKNLMVDMHRRSLTKGPSGPHLFRSSSEAGDAPKTLQMSPLLPKEMFLLDDILMRSPTAATPRPARGEIEDVEQEGVRGWSTRQVVDWMYAAGFEESTIKLFEEQEITGDVLLDMKPEHLKELGIASFGKRHSIWNKLAVLREDGGLSPAATVFEDITRPATTATERPSRHERSRSDTQRDDCESDSPTSPYAPRVHKLRRNKRTPFSEALTPAESVSIVAIEQLIPRPHSCSRGTDCPKHKKQERLRKQIAKENAVSPAHGGQIWITGDFDEFPGHQPKNALRDTEPSVVASSDLLGGQAQPPEFTMDKDMQRKKEKYEAQDSVKQYLTLQHVRPGDVNALPTPPLETPQFNGMRETVPTPKFAPSQQVHQPPPAVPIAKLQKLPKLSIPRSASTGPASTTSARPRRSPRNVAPSPLSHQVHTPAINIQRGASPASMNDLPRRSMTLTPIPRDQSQTVPPSMRFRPPMANRSSRSPSTWQRASMKQPLQGIPEYGCGPTPISPVRSPITVSPRIAYGASTTHAGYMRKRRTKLLRHEWETKHVRLQGTQLALHATARPDDKKALDKLDIEDFTVACSSVSSDSKLAAALKSLRIKSEKKEAGLDDAAFVFQLVPSGDRSKVLSMLREMGRGSGTHHFAVKGREERVDWMREVMLAKARRAREEGCSVTVNNSEVVQ